MLCSNWWLFPIESRLLRHIKKPVTRELVPRLHEGLGRIFCAPRICKVGVRKGICCQLCSFWVSVVVAPKHVVMYSQPPIPSWCSWEPIGWGIGIQSCWLSHRGWVSKVYGAGGASGLVGSYLWNSWFFPSGQRLLSSLWQLCARYCQIWATVDLPRRASSREEIPAFRALKGRWKLGNPLLLFLFSYYKMQK